MPVVKYTRGVHLSNHSTATPCVESAATPGEPPYRDEINRSAFFPQTSSL